MATKLRAITSPLSVLQRYNALVSSQVIRDDPHQRATLEQLESVHATLAQYKHTWPSKWTAWLQRTTVPRGVYMHGGVGCGKTMLMDMFYTTVPVHLSRQRLHYDQFMINVHKAAHHALATHGPNHDPLPGLAAEIARSSRVLCLDEFQVVDVADAMLLRRLMELLVRPPNGVVFYITSNRRPRDLYKNGVQRASFVPCIDLIERQCHVVELSSPTDYRRSKHAQSRCYYTPPGDATLRDFATQAARHVDTWFAEFASSQPAAQPPTVSHNLPLPVWGRVLVVPKCVPGRVAQFSFHELCEQPTHAADYIELARAFHCLVVTDIPRLSVEDKDVLRRFITFVDAAYESHTRLAVTSERPFQCLFTGIPQNPDDRLCAAAAEERFALKRALSRLDQMGGDAWLERASTTLTRSGG